jgi:hypothetical protein
MQGPMLAGQVLYCFSQTSGPLWLFCRNSCHTQFVSKLSLKLSTVTLKYLKTKVKCARVFKS